MRLSAILLTPFLAGTLVLAACNKPKDAAAASDVTAAPTPGAPRPADKTAPPGVSVPMLAYSYTLGVTAPAKAVPDLIALHQKLCADAGPAQCQVTAAAINRTGEDGAAGTLTLRAAPAWLAAFRARVPADAKTAGGQLADSQVQTDDLSRQIIDTEAAVRARITLRDRLEGILASRPGKLSDLLEVERELARVQGELDATQSELAVMRTRVATSLLTINYQSSAGLMAPRGAWAPLAQAFRNMSGVLAATLAAMVTLFTAIAPWAILLGLVFWLGRGPLRALWSKPTPLPRDTPKIPEP